MTSFKKFDPHAYLAAIRSVAPGHAQQDQTETLASLAALAAPRAKIQNSEPHLDQKNHNQFETCPPAKLAKVETLGGTFPFAGALNALERRCPEYVDPDRWYQGVEDGRRFLAQWGRQSTAFGWTVEELFGLHEPPEIPHPSYDRLARYDYLGLVWLLVGRPVFALTASTAMIQTRTGAVAYRKTARSLAAGADISGK
jgi:hypothetical protein